MQSVVTGHAPITLQWEIITSGGKNKITISKENRTPQTNLTSEASVRTNHIPGTYYRLNELKHETEETGKQYCPQEQEMKQKENQIEIEKSKNKRKEKQSKKAGKKTAYKGDTLSLIHI